MAFMNINPFPGVWHIQDAMGVCMTLIAGTKRAVLIDAGYGLEDVSSYINTLTSLPVRVILTHGHHDHVLGARWFSETYMSALDQEDFYTYTAFPTRSRILGSAKEKGITTDEQAFLHSPIKLPLAQTEETIDLGDLSLQIISCPGHTPGSLAAFIPEYGLFLSGDDWNPCTWLFFKKALPCDEYKNNLQRIVRLLPIKHVLCSHRFSVYEPKKLYDFLEGLTDDCLRAAQPKPELSPSFDIDPRECIPAEDQVLVFDWNKYRS